MWLFAKEIESLDKVFAEKQKTTMDFDVNDPKCFSMEEEEPKFDQPPCEPIPECDPETTPDVSV